MHPSSWARPAAPNWLRILPILVLAPGLLLIAYQAGAEPGPPHWSAYLAPMLPLLGSLLLALRWRMRGARPGSQDDPLLYLGLGLTFWFLGSAIRVILAAARPGQFLPPSLADLIYLAGYPALWMALLAALPGPARQFGRVLLGLDFAITALASAVLLGMVLFDPLLNFPPANLSASFWTLAMPIFDLALLVSILCALLINEETWLQRRLLIFSAGLVFSVLGGAFLVYARFAAQPVLAAPSTIFNFLSQAVVFLTLLASRRPRPVFVARPSGRINLRRSIQRLLPLAATVVLVWYVVLTWRPDHPISGLLAAQVCLLVILLILRQGVVTGEQSLSEYALLVDSAADATFIINQAGLIQYANPAMRRACGLLGETELLNQPLARFLPGLEARAWLREAEQAGWSGELELAGAQGQRLPVFVSLRPFGHPGRKKSILAGSAHDLTLQKRQQAALQRAYAELEEAHRAVARLNTGLEEKVAEKTHSLTQAYVQLEEQHATLRKLDELKSDFVSLVSHELRAPLTNIGGGIELVLSSPSLPDPARASLSLVQVEILRLNHFVEAILDLSALDAGRLPIYPAPLALPGLVELLGQQMASMPEIGRVVWEIPEHLPFVMADERALPSVLFHLIDNALKYAPHGPVRVRAWPEDERVLVAVEDEGPGIAPESLPLLFEKFYRSHPGDAQTVYGHGVGLYMARRLLQAMDGDIRAENRPEDGALFTFWLPAVQENDER